MPGNYSAEVIGEVARIARAQGLEYGYIIKEAIVAGELTPGQRINLLIPIGDIKLERFSLLTRATLAFGTPTAGVVGNSVIVGMGIYTGGSSALQFGITTDRKAQGLYALSAVFSSSAVVSGSVAVMSRTCDISGTAALSEAFGYTFMMLGNKAHVMALQLEGKPVPPKLQRYVDPTIRPLNFNPGGLGFIMPRPISSTFLGYISFEQIGKLVGFGIAVYSYSRFIIVGYRYGQQFLSKFKSKNKSKLIRKQKIFLIFKIQLIISKARSKRQQNILFSTA
jgi:hypothetical protein